MSRYIASTYPSVCKEGSLLPGLQDLQPPFLSVPEAGQPEASSVFPWTSELAGAVTPEAAAMHLPSLGGAGDSSVTASPEPTCVLALRVKR